ncbi:MAG: multicopper oxidase domain-containing protein, partial [Acidimicrobiia bacterium]
MRRFLSTTLGLGLLAALSPLPGQAAQHFQDAPIPGTSRSAVTLGRDLDGDGDADEVNIRLEIIEVREEVYPGEFVNFWVFAPEGRGMTPAARVPSPTIRVEEGDRVRITLLNTHYFPHTIHLHGTIHPNDMDGVPDITQPAVKPGEAFTYEFIAKNPGTHFYHCHVQPDVHVLMGLVGMLIIEPNRPRNIFSHLVPGAGRIQDLAKAAAGKYGREYSLVYMDIDDRLNRIAAAYEDPREIEKRMHREYASTRRQPNIFMLNGRSFPFTVRDTPIEVKSGERVKLRVLNAGSRTMSLHTHGHHPTVTHLDGYEVPPQARVTRDVFTIGAAQRVDLELRPGKDDRYASGPGVWVMHDHVEKAVTNKGIGPGGDLTTIVYDGFMGADGLPKVATSLERFFDPDYYRGKVPVFDPKIFHTTREAYEYGWPEDEPEGGVPIYPVRDKGLAPLARKSALEGHQMVAKSCGKPRGFRRIRIKGGTRFAREGEVFAFDTRVIRAEPCEEIEIVLE